MAASLRFLRRSLLMREKWRILSRHEPRDESAAMSGLRRSGFQTTRSFWP